MELTDFVRAFNRAQLAERSFRFPYPVRDVYFFVESQPLQPPGFSTPMSYMTYSIDPATLAYATPSGRASLQFEAADLLAAYARSHSDLKVVFSDPQFTVYRASGQIP